MVFGVLKLKEKVPSELVPTSGGLSSSVFLHTHDLPARVSQISPWALPAGDGEGNTVQSPSAALALGSSSWGCRQQPAAFRVQGGRQRAQEGHVSRRMAKMHS